ncbi:MAG: helix-turn-helix domain-containing protein, partial [Candidatus Delongbacteria bacterium]|nr:helix-turn-helix domain-containing protein [Candidatus Delongbacteria bacterium]
MIRDIGNNLKAKRTESGLSISDISQKTKIRESFIAAIENNDKSSVPESYYDLFLKKYADFLHIELTEDEEKKKQNDLILELLTEKNGNKKKKNQFVLGIKRILLFIYMHKKTFAALIFLFLFFLFIRYIYIILNTGEKSEKSESMVKIITIEGDPDDKISINIRDSIMIDDDKIEYFFLKISA